MPASSNKIIDRATQVLKDYFTGPDGETYAVGRGLGVGLFLFGLFLPTVLAFYMLKTAHPSLADWCGFLAAMAAYLPALTGAVVILITLTNPTEPKA
jgi:hypothetical protein